MVMPYKKVINLKHEAYEKVLFVAVCPPRCDGNGVGICLLREGD